MKKLSELQVRAQLNELDGWEFHDDAIQTSFEFKDFKDAFSVMTRIAFEAEGMNHHPNWFNVYNRLDISLSTHDAGGVTEKDFELARIIDNLVG